MTATEMNAAVDRIVKLAHALTQLREQLARCEGVTAHARVALASAQAAHRRAEADEERARAALVAALGETPAAASSPELEPSAAAASTPAAAPAAAAPPVADEDVFSALLDRIEKATDEAALNDIRNEVVAEHKNGRLDEREARDLVHSCDTNAADLRAERDGAIDPAASAILRAELKGALAAAMDVHSLGQVHTYRVLTAQGRLVPADRAELDAFYASRRDGFAAAEKAAKKSPRKPRPSECWTVRRAGAEVHRGGKAAARACYRNLEAELQPGEKLELRTPHGDALVHCTGKPRPWRIEAKRAGAAAADAWEDLGPAEDALDAREAYDLALRGSEPGDRVRLRRPDGTVEREEEVVAADAGGALESRAVEPGPGPSLPRTGWTWRKCPACDGHGEDNNARACASCGGTGDERVSESVAGDEAASPATPDASDDDARCDELLRTRTRHPHVVLAWPGGGGAGPDWGVVFEGATLGSALKAQRAAVKRLRGTGGRVRRYENAALVETLPVAPGGGAARPAGGGAAAAAAEVSP